MLCCVCLHVGLSVFVVLADAVAALARSQDHTRQVTLFVSLWLFVLVYVFEVVSLIRLLVG